MSLNNYVCHCFSINVKNGCRRKIYHRTTVGSLGRLWQRLLPWSVFHSEGACPLERYCGCMGGPARGPSWPDPGAPARGTGAPTHPRHASEPYFHRTHQSARHPHSAAQPATRTHTQVHGHTCENLHPHHRHRHKPPVFPSHVMSEFHNQMKHPRGADFFDPRNTRQSSGRVPQTAQRIGVTPEGQIFHSLYVFWLQHSFSIAGRMGP